MAIRVTFEKANRGKQEMHTRNLKEANRTVRQYIPRVLLDSMAYDLTSLDSDQIEELFVEIQNNIQLRFPEVREVKLDPRGMYGQDYAGITEEVLIGENMDVDDPFRTTIAKKGTLEGLSYDLYIGYGDEDGDNYVTPDTLHGYRVDYEVGLKARRIAPENFAWAHYGDKHNPVWSADLSVVVPPYVVNSSSVDEEHAELMQMRSSTIMLKSDALQQNTSTVDRYFAMEGFKPIYVAPKQAEDAPRLNWSLHPTVNQPMGVSEGDNPSISIFPENSRGTGMTEDEAGMYSKFITSKEAIESAGGKLVVFSEVEDSVRSMQNDPESSAGDFWDAYVSSDSDPNIYRPALAATVLVDVLFDGTGGLTLQVKERTSVGLDILSNELDFIIKLGPALELSPGDPGYAEWVTGFLEEFGEDASSVLEGDEDPVAVGEVATGSILDGLPDGYPVITGIPLDWATENTPREREAAWLQRMRDIELAFDLDAEPGSIIKESYYGGALRLQTLPNMRSIEGESVVFDMGLLPPTAIPLHADADFPSQKGIYVNAAMVIDGSTTTEQRTAAARFMNASLILARSALDPTSTFYWEGVPSEAGAMMPTSELSNTWVYGTNGRLVFDTAVNINAGAYVNAAGVLEANVALNEVNHTNMASTSAFYGDNIAPLDITVGAHRNVYASRLRPSVIKMVTPSSAASDGVNPAITNWELIERIFYTAPNPALGTTPLVLEGNPNHTMYNLYASGLTSSFSEIGGQAFFPVNDLPGVTLDLGSASVDRETDISNMLQSYAEQALKELVSSPTQFYGAEIADRLSSPNPALASLQDEIYNRARVTSSVPPEAMIINYGRREAYNYVHVYFQRYGYQLDVTDSFDSAAPYNFRPMFSGNVKQTVVRFCRTDAEKLNLEVPTDEGTFRAEEDAMVTLGSGEEVQLAFRDCPAEELISVNVDASLTSPMNQDILGRDYEATERITAFFYPVLTGEQGPESIEALLLDYLNPTTAMEDALNDSNKLVLASVPYMTWGVAEFIGVEALPADGVVAMAATAAGLSAKASEILQLPDFSTGAITPTGQDWEEVLSLSPFFGRIQYTLAYASDEGVIDAFDAENDVTNLHRLRAYWTTSSPDLRLTQVKVEEYNSTTLTLGGNNTELLPWDALTGPEQARVKEGLDDVAEDALTTFMDAGLYNDATAQAYAGHCFNSASIPLTTLEGGITGRVDFDLSPSMGDLDYTIFFDEDHGHDTSGVYFLEYQDSLPSLVRVATLGDGLQGDTTTEGATRIFSPAYDVQDAASSVRTPVRGDIELTRSRLVDTAEVFEPRTSNLTDDIASSGAQIIVNSATNTGVDMLSGSIKTALLYRTVTLKVFVAGRTMGTITPPDYKPFAGVGTIMTAANSPHALITPSLGILANDPTIQFGWTGSIKTGIGTEWDVGLSSLSGDVDSATPSLMKTTISGDPAMSSQQWGSIGVAEKLDNVEVEADFNRITRRRQ